MECHANTLLGNVNIGTPTMESVTNHLVGTVDVDPMTIQCRCYVLNNKVNTMLSSHVLLDTDVRDLWTIMGELGIRDQWKEMNAKIRAELEGISQNVGEATKVLDANPPDMKWVNQHYGCGTNFVFAPVVMENEVAVAQESVAQESVQETVQEAVQETVQESVEVTTEVGAEEKASLATEATVVGQTDFSYIHPMFATSTAVPVFQTVPIVQTTPMFETVAMASEEVKQEEVTVGTTASAETEATAVGQTDFSYVHPMFATAVPVIRSVPVMETVTTVPVTNSSSVEYKPVFHKEVRWGLDKPQLLSMPFQEWTERTNKNVAKVSVNEIIPETKQVVERRLFGEWDALMEDVVEWHKRGLQRYNVRMNYCVCPVITETITSQKQ